MYAPGPLPRGTPLLFYLVHQIIQAVDAALFPVQHIQQLPPVPVQKLQQVLGLAPLPALQKTPDQRRLTARVAQVLYKRLLSITGLNRRSPRCLSCFMALL